MEITKEQYCKALRQIIELYRLAEDKAKGIFPLEDIVKKDIEALEVHGKIIECG